DEVLRVDEADQVEREAFGQLRGQGEDAVGRGPVRAGADDAGGAYGQDRDPGVQGVVQVGGAAVSDGDARAADGGRHVGVREHGADDRLRLRHDLLRRAVVDGEGGQADAVQADAFEAFLPGLREAVPGLGAVADDGE